MSAHITVGIDNGQSGSIGIITPTGTTFEPIPTQPYLHYGKAGSIGQRLHRLVLKAMLAPCLCPGLGEPWVGADNVRVYIERPFSGRFIKAVVPAHRFFESTVTVMEDLALGYEVVDSGPWQKGMLGKVKGSAALKLASKLRGEQMYPQFRDFIREHGDADGLLMARYYHHL